MSICNGYGYGYGYGYGNGNGNGYGNGDGCEAQLREVYDEKLSEAIKENG